MEGKYCVRCGAMAEMDPEPPQRASFSSAGANLEKNLVAALCYLVGFVTGLVFLWLSPYRNEREIRFHAFQSILFSVAYFVLYAVVTIAALVLSVLSLGLGAFVSTSLHLAVNVVFLVAWLYLMWKAYRAERVMLPVIGKMADEIAGEEEPRKPSGTMGKAA
jgi:uncharacterized membrane protein